MAFAHFSFYSKVMSRIMEFELALPNDMPEQLAGKDNPAYQRGMKTLILLHGYSGICSDWFISGNASDLAGMFHAAVVCPSGENSFYTDMKGTGHAYCRYIGEELPEYIARTFGLSNHREDVLIGGYSMGGYGALHIGLTYPDRFCGIMALSSALIMDQLKGIMPGMNNGFADYDYYVSVFGNLLNAANTDINPAVQVIKAIANQAALPDIFMACGAQDFLHNENVQFSEFLDSHHVKHAFEEGDGQHNFDYWKPKAISGLRYLLKKDGLK